MRVSGLLANILYVCLPAFFLIRLSCRKASRLCRRQLRQQGTGVSAATEGGQKDPFPSSFAPVCRHHLSGHLQVERRCRFVQQKWTKRSSFLQCKQSKTIFSSNVLPVGLSFRHHNNSFFKNFSYIYKMIFTYCIE